jgi:hypothetical protein
VRAADVEAARQRAKEAHDLEQQRSCEAELSRLWREYVAWDEG